MNEVKTTPTLTLPLRDRVSLPGLALEVIDPNGRSRETSIALGLGELVVGTSEDADVVLEDGAVSRRHLSVRLTERGVLVTDLESKNGTWLDGMRIRAAYAPLDGEIAAGETRLLVRGAQPTEIALSPGASFGEALGGSVVMRALFARLECLTRSTETVVLLGESGTGKELLARALHDKGPRRDGPFVVVDCGAIPPGLVESELFGHEAGAFTGAERTRIGSLEQASGGTLLLDEVGELPLEAQSRLLRALEARVVRRVGGSSYLPIDVRLVAATHRDLASMVRAGTFRQDLFYRLAVVVERVPALRERIEDVELLTERFLAKQPVPRSLEDLPRGTLAMLKTHSFPGNVRELFNVLARLVVFPDLGRALFDGQDGTGDPRTTLRLDLGWREARERAVDDFEQRYLRGVLDLHDGNVTRAATAMGVSRQFLYRLLERHDLRPTLR